MTLSLRKSVDSFLITVQVYAQCQRDRQAISKVFPGNTAGVRSITGADKRLAQTFLPTLLVYSVSRTDKRSALSFLETIQVYVLLPGQTSD